MVLAARLVHTDVPPKTFIVDIVNPKVGVSDLRTMYKFIDIIKDYEGNLDLVDWKVPAGLERWVE